MNKKLLHALADIVLIVILTVGVLYVLVLTVKPARAVFLNAARGTVLEKFLPEENEHEHDLDHAEETAASQIAEIALSPTVSKNIGLDDSTIMAVEVVNYYKSFSFPGVVVERPGFSTMIIPSPMSGVITKIYHETGVAVEPGEPLFDIMLNQQEFLKAQSELIALQHKRTINAAELEWLAGMDALIVPKQRRELEYEKIQIELDIHKNILLLQGLSESDIAESLEKSGTIIRSMTVYAPPFENEESIASTAHADEAEHIFTIDELFVSAGTSINVGDPLCRLTDYCKLAVRGKVFSANERMLAEALSSKSRVTATFEGNGKPETIEGLFLRSIDNKIDVASGTLFCYVDLRNDFTQYAVKGENNQRRYIQWHFKPGQRCELNVEVEPLPNCIVLPVGAVAKDFQETYVFEWVGSEGESRIWRKKPVHVVYQTKTHVVIAHDGSLFPGAKVAVRGAGFILAALDAASQQPTGGGIQHGDHVH